MIESLGDQMVEGPIPCSGHLWIAGDLPLHEPRRCRLLHEWIPSTLAAKQALAEFGRSDARFPFFDYTAGERPMANRKRHVFPDAKGHDGFGAAKDRSRRTGFNGIKGFAQPKMPQGECLVARELPLEFARCDWPP